MFRHRLLLPASALALCCGALPAHADAPPPAFKPGSIFSEVIKTPTGQNGYEELVLAGDTLKASKLFREFESREATLTLPEKRRLLANATIQRVLLLVRKGLAKPVSSPRETLTVETRLPELATFRSIARLLKVQQYVFLADGRTGEAVTNARLCLMLGRAVQTDTLIGGLVGIAMETLAIKSLGDHLEQLTARDCEELFKVCLERLRQPDPMPQFLAAERQSSAQFVAEAAGKLKSGDASFLQKDLGLKDGEFKAADAYVHTLKPGDIDALAAQAQQRLNQTYDRLLDEWRKPTHQRDPEVLTPPASNNGPEFLVAALLPAMHRVNDVFGREDAQIRLLAVHCAILRYRWEHEALPPKLEALELGSLILDPFTGQPLTYEPRGLHYRLSSLGPVADTNDEKAVSGHRPVSIVRDDF